MHPKFSREVHLSGMEKYTEDESPKRERDVPETFLRIKDTNA